MQLVELISSDSICRHDLSRSTKHSYAMLAIDGKLPMKQTCDDSIEPLGKYREAINQSS